MRYASLKALLAIALAIGLASFNEAKAEQPLVGGQLTMSELARQYARQRGPTFVYLNFDGWFNQDGKGHAILPFSATTGNRERDIQEVLYRTAEIFAPFNVQVMRMYGNGHYDRGKYGNTTVFIGANTANLEQGGRKFVAYVTPNSYVDSARADNKNAHVPDSEPFHLAFVDHVGQRNGSEEWVSCASNTAISRHTAHEAGHTLGLVHVSSKGYPDLMSYDASARSFFANRTFPLSDLNFNAKKGTKDHAKSGIAHWYDRPITGQNAFEYLTIIRGRRTPDDHPNVADRHSIDPEYQESDPQPLTAGSQLEGAIAPRGDYDVFTAPAELTTTWQVTVHPDQTLRPVILIFDEKGERLKGFSESKKPGRDCTFTLHTPVAGVFRVVIGAADGATVGGYRVEAHPTHLPNELALGR